MSSLKGFILIPLSLHLYKNGLFKSIPIILISFFVSNFTGGRTQFFMFLLIIIISLINNFLRETIKFLHVKKINFLNFSFFLGIPIFISITLRKLFLSEFAFKTMGVFNTVYKLFISNGIDINFAYMVIDPFRFYETREWVNSGLNTLLFGNGFGSGININDLLFVDIRSMGYSITEINEGIAFKP